MKTLLLILILSSSISTANSSTSKEDDKEILKNYAVYTSEIKRTVALISAAGAIVDRIDEVNGIIYVQYFPRHISKLAVIQSVDDVKSIEQHLVIQ
jgi:hypothetical protein